MDVYGSLGAEINRWWILWASRHPINLQGAWTALKQHEFIYFFGPGHKSKMGPVSYQMFSMNSYGLRTALAHYDFVRFSGPGDNSKIGLVSYGTPCESMWFLSGFETMWIHSLLGPEINRRWVLSAITHPINVYRICAVLKQYEFGWLSGLGNKSMMGVVSYHTPYRCTRLLGSFEPVWTYLYFWTR